jgi:hypothetical protein
MSSLRLLPDLEDALRSLPGIQAVSVVTSGTGAPTEVHVLAAPGKPAKQVVRDVQSLAMAGFDLDIDHRIVSVVQIGEAMVDEDPATGPGALEIEVAEDPRRAVITSVGLRTAGPEATATVTLSVGSEEFLGSAVGSVVLSQRPRLAAAATLDAVSPLLGTTCEIESAQVVTAGSHQVAVVVLSLLAPRSGQQLLTGSAAVRSHAEDAVCRAVLNALNRQLTG